MDRYQHGVPAWVDVGVDDPGRTARFFTELWGWDCPEGPPETGGYRNCTMGGRTVAGIGPRMNPEAPPLWASYVNVDDADAVVELVGANGGSVIVAPMDVMAFGRMAVFADPAGAVFSVWQAGTHHGCGVVNEPGAFSWSELLTDDTAGARAFYPAVFGWTFDETDGYTEWKVDGRSVAGMMARPPGMPAEVPPLWMVYFAVDDVDAAAARIPELGGTVAAPPMDIPQGRFAVVEEPCGAVFQIIALAEGLGG
jgi:predicted enzyme related to lactoylglutathione lyase